MVSLSLTTVLSAQVCFLVIAAPTCGLKALHSKLVRGKNVRRPGPTPPEIADWNCAETRTFDLHTALACVFECEVGSMPRGRMVWSNNTASCPASSNMATHVTLNRHDPTGPMLVTMQEENSFTKDATYVSAMNTANVLLALQWTSSANGGIIYTTGVDYASPLALLGYPYESRLRDMAVNGTEAGTTTINVGAALLHSGVSAVDGSAAQVAAQTVLAEPSSPAHYRFGFAVAIVELVANTDYHIALAHVLSSADSEVHVYRVQPGGVGVGWGVPVITPLGTLPRPWAWGGGQAVLAARDATAAGGRPAALVVGTESDPRCGPSSGWPDTCDYAGGAHVYTLDSMSGVWAWQGVLKAPYVRDSMFCGFAVAISGDLVTVGCPGDNSPSTAVDVDEALETGVGVGAAHAWRLDPANASASVREGYLKAFAAADGQALGWAVAAAANTTHEVIAATSMDSTGPPYGDLSAGLAMPYDTPGSGSGEASEGAVWTFVHAVGGGGVGTWRAAHRLKAPVGLDSEVFGWGLTAATTAAGEVVLGVGTYLGCRGYVVVLP